MTDWKIKGRGWVVLEELDDSHLLNIEHWLAGTGTRTRVPARKLQHYLEATRIELAKRGIQPLSAQHQHQWTQSAWATRDQQTLVVEWTCTVCLITTGGATR